MNIYSRHVEREILSALMDGELDARERAMVHEHLQECEDCRELSEEFGTLQGMLGGLPRLVAPESFVSDALTRQDRTGPVGRAWHVLTRGRRRFVSGGLATVAVVTTLAGLVVPPEAQEPPVGVYVTRHVSVSSGDAIGGDVLFAVHGR